MENELPKTFVKGFHDEESVRKFRYNCLGNTDMKVSALALGTSQLAFCHERETEKEGIETVIQSVKKGINYIDTAPYYGEGAAETVLGKALRKIPREAYYIATKVGRYTTKVETMFDFSAEKVTEGLKQSMELLGVSYVDVIQVHDIEFAPSVDILLNETLPALQKLKEAGQARYIGITGYPLSELKKLLERSKVKIDVVLSYCRYTLFDQLLDSYIPDFQKHGVGIINAAILGMSLLTSSELPIWHPVKPALRNACQQAKEYCQEHGVDISRLATYFSLSHRTINTHVIGMSNMNVLNKNLNVTYDGLSEKELQLLDDIRKRFFLDLDENNWENVELEHYWKVMKTKSF